MMRELQRVVGKTHNLMGSHKRGMEARGSMRSALVPVWRPSLKATHMTVKEIDTQEREIHRRVKEKAFQAIQVREVHMWETRKTERGKAFLP